MPAVRRWTPAIGLVKPYIVYSVGIGVGVIVGAVGWHVVSSRAALAQFALSKLDARHKKRLLRGKVSADAEPAMMRRHGRRNVGDLGLRRMSEAIRAVACDPVGCQPAVLSRRRLQS